MAFAMGDIQPITLYIQAGFSIIVERQVWWMGDDL